MKALHNTVIAGLITALGSFQPVFSQDNTQHDGVIGKRSLSAGIGFPDDTQPFEGRIGLGIGPFPSYEGSNDYGMSALPLVNIGKPGTYFLKGASTNLNEGLASAGLTILHLSYAEETNRRMRLVIGPLVRAYAGRNQDDNDALNGLGDIDQSIGIGGFLELYTGPFLTSASVSRQNVGNDKNGRLVTLDVKYATSVSKGLEITTGLSTSWADDNYMQGYFGVTGTQATQSGLSPFDSQAGFKDVGLQLKAVYELSPRWSLEGEIGYWHLLNDAADSPIVKNDGSTNQVRGLVGLSFQF